jgi:hypothetical protein
MDGYCSQSSIVIPLELCTDFLGTMALDILHDAKGYGLLAGHLLSQLTDLLAEAVIEKNPTVNPGKIKNYFFKCVLIYFQEVWVGNLGALGMDHQLDQQLIQQLDQADLNHLRETVRLPVRSVADRSWEDTFCTLGTNERGVEVHNYYLQKNRLIDYSGNTEFLAFVSPQGIHSADDYFNRAKGIVDIIQVRSNAAKIVLDMKSSACLLRTITDPIGYRTGLPTYADPGYNMPGMSAIRQHSNVSFLPNSEHQTWQKCSEFQYTIKLQMDQMDPVTFMKVHYFYGAAKPGLDRENMMINVSGQLFHSFLPRSTVMAETLGKFLKPRPCELTMTVGEMFSSLKELIIDWYSKTCPETSYSQILNSSYSKLHQNQLTLEILQSLMVQSMIPEIMEWCDQSPYQIFTTGYLLATFKNANRFQIVNFDPRPLEMITVTFPQMMKTYCTMNKEDPGMLGFCYYQLALIEQYLISVPDQELRSTLANQKAGKGKVTTLISRKVQEWRQRQQIVIQNHWEYVSQYLNQVTETCRQELDLFVDPDPAQPRIQQLLEQMPIFNPPVDLATVLGNHFYFYYPDLYHRCQQTETGGLWLAALLDTFSWRKPLMTNLDLQAGLTKQVSLSADEIRYTAMCTVLGKFSGDFGQIVWSIANGELFASEDNNASAMALLMHRVPRHLINTDRDKGTVWGNIHGLGDGSSVDVVLHNSEKTDP